MNKYILCFASIILICVALIGTSFKAADQSQPLKNFAADSAYNQYILDLYQTADLDSVGLSEQVFEKALTGYYNMKYSGLLHEKSVLTIADFDQESCKKRMYIIDIDKKKLILNTWVAHGQNSGGDKPSNFSNIQNSNQSSLGFYLTGEIYFGKHGRSLKLDGMDQNFNSKARDRAIVLHGADYVSQETINKLGRLGRSQGCPAVPTKLANKVIDAISDRTVLFINSSKQAYQSSLLNETLAANAALNQNNMMAAQMN
ncbi:MAG: murein L,D-transpeptidase catalytic domain family protein [Pedobacter sp.]|jgi:hypothetical protein|nr:MAG: murein L,D-transpeptidase catalytic domain family protein [Pedobacter sp.]